MGKDGLNIGLHSKVAEDAFGFSLGYFNQDYKSVTNNYYISSNENNFLANITNNSELNNRNLYNGNITHMVTAIKPLMTTGNSMPQTMVYNYDLLNRIAGAKHLITQIDAQNKYLQTLTDDKYKTQYTYDQNGNITTLKRHDENGVLFDDFEYNYINNIDAPNAPTNRLGYVKDFSSSSLKDYDIDNQNSGNYSYNKIGQLTKDIAEGIAKIEWNNQGKVTKIIQNDLNPNTEFKYGPMGNRIVKIVKPKDASGVILPENKWIKTYYVRDAQGNVMAVYNIDEMESFATHERAHFTLKEHHLYGSSRLGVENKNTDLAIVNMEWNGGMLKSIDTTLSLFTKNQSYFTQTIGDKNYELSNHLGNVLVVVSDRKLVKPYVNGSFDGFEPDIVTFSDYYPFGMLMPERNGGSAYRYSFNGMEKDDEVKGKGNHLDFGARCYDSRLGRWFSVDAMAGKQPAWSPYKMAKDNPMIYKDPDGNTEYITIIIDNKQTGEYVKLRVVVSDDVKLRMNIQTAVPYYHDIETTYVITIDKDGNSSMKSYINQAGKKRGNIFFKMQNYFKSGGSQKWGMYFTSKDGEGTTIEGKNILGSGNIDDILGLIKDLSAIQSKSAQKAMDKKIKDIQKKIKEGVESSKMGTDLEGHREAISDEMNREEKTSSLKKNEDQDTVITINRWETKGSFVINHIKDTTVKKSEVNTINKDRKYVKGQ